MSAGIQTSEVSVGAHRIFWGAAGSETELGLTAEGSIVRIGQEQVPVKTEEYGTGENGTPVKKIHGGETMVAELILAQWSPAQLLIAIPGSVAGTGTDTASVYIGKQAGTDLSGTTYARRLRLHPITQTNTATETNDVYIHLAIPKPLPIEARFNNREAKMIGVSFEGIVDTTQSDGSRLGRIRVT